MRMRDLENLEPHTLLHFKRLGTTKEKMMTAEDYREFGKTGRCKPIKTGGKNSEEDGTFNSDNEYLTTAMNTARVKRMDSTRIL